MTAWLTFIVLFAFNACTGSAVVTPVAPKTGSPVKVAPEYDKQQATLDSQRPASAAIKKDQRGAVALARRGWSLTVFTCSAPLVIPAYSQKRFGFFAIPDARGPPPFFLA